MTRRDLQGASKSKQRPWDTGKDVESSAICSPLKPVEKVPGMAAQGPIELRVNGLARQEGDVRDHVWSIEEIIADLSTLYTLQPGDLIFMGTPSGVAAVQAGDVREGAMDGVGESEDVAHLARFLIGQESRWVTGCAINVDGGHALRRGPNFTQFIEPAIGKAALPGHPAGS